MHTINKIETILIIRDFLKEELKRKGYEWTPSLNGELVNGSSSENTHQISSLKRKKIVNSLCSLSKSLRNIYQESVSRTCEEFKTGFFENSTIFYDSFQSIGDEIFSKGIMWGHIVTFLIFGSELAYSTGNLSPSCIDNINEFLATYINDHIYKWINDHGGWDGLIEYSRQQDSVDAPTPKHDWKDNQVVKIGTVVGLIGIAVTLVGFYFSSKH